MRLRIADLLSWLDSTAEELACLGTRELGYVDFTEELLRSRGVVALRAGSTVAHAKIVPVETGYAIIVREHMDEPAWRFAVAHELGHTYWFAPDGGGQPLSPYQNVLGPDPTIEQLCNKFAAALLLPKSRFSRWLRNRGFRPGLDLRLIGEGSKFFRAPEQAVAKRALHELLSIQVAVVCVRLKHKGDNGKVLWCVLPPALKGQGFLRGLHIPFRTVGRLIPSAMIPDLQEEATYSGELDSRWWTGVLPAPRAQSRKPFGLRPPTDSKDGYACRIRDRLYVALPLT